MLNPWLNKRSLEYLRKIEEYYCDGCLVDYAIVNTKPIDKRLSRLYAIEGKYPVEPDLETCQKLVTTKVISGNFVAEKNILRHNSEHLAEILHQKNELMCLLPNC